MKKLRLSKLEQFDEERLLSTTDSVLLSLNTIAVVLNEDNPLFTEAKDRVDFLEKGEFIKLTTTATKYNDGSITTQFSPASPHYIHPQVANEYFSNYKDSGKSIIHLEIFIVKKRKPDSESRTKKNKGLRDQAKAKKRLFDLLDLVDEEEFGTCSYYQMLQDTIDEFNLSEDTEFDSHDVHIEYLESRGTSKS